MTGVVVRRLREHLDVTAAGTVLRCTPAGSLRHAEQQPVVGDRVTLTAAAGRTGVVQTVQPRRNALRRRAAGPRPDEQVLAANVDRLIIVVAAADPKPKWPLVDRYLVTAEAEGLAALICLTKVDLPGASAARHGAALYERLGYPVAYVAADDPDGVAALRAQLIGQTSVFVGKSGVGKTTLVNLLSGEPCGRTQAVSRRTHKGRHTTTEVAAVALPEGGLLIDTPGVREFALASAAAGDIAAGFVEMRPLLERCRFRADCTHTHEKECAVKAAVADGTIDARRYQSYLRLVAKGNDRRQRGDAGPRSPSGDTPADGGFACIRCGTPVPYDAHGTRQRNHCPLCLWSVHLDVRPGDRAAGCGGAMEPIAIWARPGGEWALVHRCERCGAVRTNRIAGDDNEAVLMSLAVRALASPPFPLDRIGGAVRA
ncbi:MAG: ribosome small subunit-dependent GTPase A [Phycisphaerae bacterium]|nr:ribosome small subunit-dependent GTPase A [Phycisphaerae bacterium]